MSAASSHTWSPDTGPYAKPPRAGGTAVPRPATLHFSVLGPLTVEREDGPAHLGPAMERALLALLALRANEDVPREEVIDALWGEHPPPSAWSLVHTHVARLRKWLEARRGDGPGTMLAGDTGYRLVVDPAQLDLLRFYEAAERAELVHARDPAGSRAYYEEALRCWRGPVLSDLPARLREHPAAQAAAERRIALALVHAQLTCAEGRFADAAAWLGPLADEEPLHQSLAAHLMLSLAGLGDYDPALTVYENLRARLAEELHTEPGPEAQHARAYVRHRQRAAEANGSAAPTNNGGRTTPHGAEPGTGPAPGPGPRPATSVATAT